MRFDAVVIRPSTEGAERLATSITARDFVVDAVAHCHFHSSGSNEGLIGTGTPVPAECVDPFSSRADSSFAQAAAWRTSPRASPWIRVRNSRQSAKALPFGRVPERSIAGRSRSQKPDEPDSVKAEESILSSEFSTMTGAHRGVPPFGANPTRTVCG